MTDFDLPPILDGYQFCPASASGAFGAPPVLDGYQLSPHQRLMGF
jgi:hypothetical protein